MNKGHIKSGEAISLKNLGNDMQARASYALIRTKAMEVIRMVIPKGKTIAEHSVEGEVTVQCLQGSVDFEIENATQHLSQDSWLHLNKKAPHALTAKEDTVLLLTILFSPTAERIS